MFNESQGHSLFIPPITTGFECQSNLDMEAGKRKIATLHTYGGVAV
jgi:hypothetical protein